MSNDRTIAIWPSLLIGMEHPATLQAGGRPFADWTRLLAEGDDEAWRWFHGRYYVTLLRYAAHRSGDASAAGEIVQQTYLRVARHAKPFAGEADFANWLSCLLRCAVSDHSRQRVRRSLLTEKFAHWCATHFTVEPDKQDSAGEIASLAHEALAELPAADAELLRRKYCEGSTTAELASELATTVKAIEHRLARHRAALREIILRIQ